MPRKSSEDRGELWNLDFSRDWGKPSISIAMTDLPDATFVGAREFDNIEFLQIRGELPWPSTTQKKSPAFERSSKRRKGYPSETHVKRGLRVVHEDKDLLEKLGRNDLCPCGSGRSFQEVLLAIGRV